MTGRVVAVVDPAAEAFDMAGYGLVKAHQHDPCRVANSDLPDSGLLKLAGNPEAGGVQDGDLRHTGRRIFARPKPQIGDIAIDRRADGFLPLKRLAMTERRSLSSARPRP